MVLITSRIQSGFEPIPGYILRNKLGTGGYGEVWLADAPGGLKKAIKFVHGSIDEDKATSELKSLQRIRQVNHPFILSLERIEVVEGQLIIVTELANGSLYDRFVEFRDKGFVGVPRERLLGYLSDAADGLDFLCQQHDLQHLDVKPANLLLVADRVKVADFGLIKDIQSNSLSVMGGLTPTYAAPEMFDGRPGRYSDQYSLAIVYQELLTGTLPFRGRTTAQLANEHLHKAPNLEAVPLLERPILSKALAKKPQMRFSDCRELIKALERVQSTAADSGNPSDGINPSISSAAKKANRQQAHNKAKMKPVRVAPVEALSSSKNTDSVIPVARANRSVEVLPPLESIQASDFIESSEVLSRIQDNELAHERKSLVIGLGGTGAYTLMAMRRRILEVNKDRLCKEQLGFLIIDTDQNAIEQASNRESEERLPFHSLVHIPLKAPQYYRQSSSSSFPQLSRRWVYNIPRSLKTEGVRPLGMLAFLDNVAMTFESIQHAIIEVAQSHGEDRSNEPVFVQIVASAHGGTGSAIAAEVGFLVRQHAAQFEIPIDLELILTCATPHGIASTDLMTASALACLTEINHYFETEGLHPALDQLPPSQAIHQPPFDHVTLIHGGHCGNGHDWEGAVTEAACYLYASTETELGLRLSMTRRKNLENNRAENGGNWTSWLSTVNVRVFEIDSNIDPVVSASRLCLRAILPWIGTLNGVLEASQNGDDGSPIGPDSKVDEQIDLFVGDMFRTNQWTAQAWVHNCMVCLLPDDPAATILSSAASESQPNSALEIPLSTDLRSELEVVCDQLAIDPVNACSLVSKLVHETRVKLGDWIANRWLSSPNTWLQLRSVLRVAAAKFSVNANSLEVVAQKLAEKHDAFLESLYNGAMPTTPDLDKKLHAMALEARFHSIASKMLERMGEHVTHLETLVLSECEMFHREMGKWTNELAANLGIRLDNSPQTQATLAGIARSEVNDNLNRYLRKSLQVIAASKLGGALDAPPSSKDAFGAPNSLNELFESVRQKFEDSKNLNNLAADESSNGEPLTCTLPGTIPTNRNSSNPNATDAISASGIRVSEKPVRLSLADEIDAARPFFVEFGGAIRNVILLPSIRAEQLDPMQKADLEFKRTATLVSEHCKTCSIYCLGERLSLSDIMDRVWMPTTDIWQLSNRLLARVDVDWLPTTT